MFRNPTFLCQGAAARIVQAASGSGPDRETWMTDAVRDNGDRGRFELAVGDEVVFATYRREAGRLVISYVYAPPVLRGTGAAGRLMEGVAARARAGGERIVPLCGYARAWLRRHSAYHDLLA